MSKHLSETGLSHLIQKIKNNYISTADTSNFASVSEAISALSLTMDSEYKLTLSGRTADGSGFTVSDVIDLPLETMVVSGAYDSANTQIVLTLKNGSTTSFPVSALVDGLQSEITAQNTLSADLISDGTTNKVVTGTDKTNWNNAYASAHTHTNKSVLDGIAANDITNWNNAYASAHTHSNIDILDAIDSSAVNTLYSAIQGVTLNGESFTPDTANTVNLTADTFDGTIEIYGSDETPLNNVETPGVYKVVYLPAQTSNGGEVTVRGANPNATRTSVLFVSDNNGIANQAEDFGGGIRYRWEISGGGIKSINWGNWVYFYIDDVTGNMSNWNEAYGNSHTHDNWDIIDNITSADTTNWDNAYASAHTHSNASALNNLTQTVIDNSHTHSNKSTLDDISSSDVSSWNDAASSAHSHTNKDVLDSITSAKTEVWDSAIQGITFNGVSLTPDTANTVDISAVTFDGEIVINGNDESPLDDVVTPGVYKVVYKEASGAKSAGDILKTTVLFVRENSYSDGHSTFTILSQAEDFGNNVRFREQDLGPIKTISWGVWNYVNFTQLTSAYTTSWSEAVDYSHWHDNISILNSITSADTENWNNAASSAHSHDNKTALDAITTGKTANWDNAYASAHTHSNKSVLDNLTQGVIDSAHTHTNKTILDGITDTAVTNWNNAASSAHSHSNSTVLDNLTQTVIDNSHTHSNKTALDDITTGKTANWDNAYASAHTHSNSTVLDGISSSDVTSWNDAASSAHSHTNKTALDTITTGKTQNWDNAYASAHTHSNATVLNGISSTDVSNWNGVTAKTDSTTFGTHSATTIANGTSSQMHLPTVSASDNNKVLMVVNGVWTLVTPSMIYSGSGAPDNSQGNNGDLYIQTS